eukprot:comp22211_c0_seq2/m.52475 comp22211_c0_seq2/g.52475  ORF comp22211_c0_seq2/g.52475 comp22211_c0_seq2/m.52475 type:complete len:358 (-) comp22211_c0_seq2:2-1075(-)
MAPKRPVQIGIPDAPESPYSLSDSGTFQKDDFAINSTGIVSSPMGLVTPTGNIMSPGMASPATRVQMSDLRVESTLGRGAGGIVCKAIHVPTGMPVALKQLNLFEDNTKHEEIIKELRALYNTDSPYIVSLYGAFYAEGTVAIALEFMDMGSIADLLKRTLTIPEPALAIIAQQALMGLVFLHKVRHIVHRDIKPANILLNSRGQVKIADFGVIKELSHSFDAAGTFVGTAPYMSPERITGQNYSFSSDVWSLGLTLLECAIGHYPYPQPKGYIDLHQNIVSMDPVEINMQSLTSNPSNSYSLAFVHFLKLCLGKDPNTRPTAFDLLEHPFITSAGKTQFDWLSWLHRAHQATAFVV